MSLMREPNKHGRGIKVPDRRQAHDIKAKESKSAEIHRCVNLLREAYILATGYSRPSRHGPDDPLHHELARKSEEDCVKGNEGEIAVALAILKGRIGTLPGYRV